MLRERENWSTRTVHVEGRYSTGLDKDGRPLHAHTAQAELRHSPGTVTVGENARALLVRDPDGHALELHGPDAPRQ